MFICWAIAASFSTYFCMYAFRKPFAAAKFEGLDLTLWVSDFKIEIGLKTAFVISQIVGYTISKYVGIKVCSEITRGRRATALVLLILLAEAALLLFAVLPNQWKILAIFLNGLPLGMVWGLVVWYLEGRRMSEILLAGLSCSFILASGMVKDVGRFVMSDWHFSEAQMPVVTGGLFLPLFLLSVWLLNQLPAPSTADVLLRVRREPMDGQQRISFMRQFLPGMIVLLVVYLFLTAYRDFRDNYGVEIFAELGYHEEPALFTRSELPVAFGVLIALAALSLIKNNRRGLIGAFVVMAGGAAMMGISTILFDNDAINGQWWMILVGLGSYLAYVPFGSMLFDRLIASTRTTGTAVFAIYVADAIGYTGSIGVQLYKDLGQSDISRLEFFRLMTYGLSILALVGLTASCLYFVIRHVRADAP
ncbi:MAG: hypothetical protein IID44_16265 [Planctomycetes bacterium]|nr:hypothetical protein [Planctomycetota bacterium]